MTDATANSDAFRTDRRNPDGTVLRATTPAQWFGDDAPLADERWLFIVPHDDDAVLGAGLLLQYAHHQGIATRILIATDGHQGYTRIEDRAHIADIRRAETRAALATLIPDAPSPDVHWLNFPDGRLRHFAGRFAAPAADANADADADAHNAFAYEVVAGHTGLANACTFHLRRFAPTRVFCCTGADLHPDHRALHEEVLISLFHAQGSIWPELGAPLSHAPTAVEMAVYCPFPALPQLRLAASPQALTRKLDAISTWASQTQIATLVQAVREGGPEEYFRVVDFPAYRPQMYRAHFRP